MIRTENTKAIGIISYCDTEEKVKVLIENVEYLRIYFSEYDIVLHSNYPLDFNIQKLVDTYIYEELNYTGDDKWIYYWNIITNNDEYVFQKKFFYSILDTGFSVFQQIQSLTEKLYHYERMMLINYDTVVKDIVKSDYYQQADFIGHYFTGQRAFSLIMMDFDPKKFKIVTDRFTYENWNNPKRKDQLNEERFFDIIQESGVSVYGHNYKVGDLINNEPDYSKPNIEDTRYFTNYIVCYNDNLLEVYIWGLKEEINKIKIVSQYSQYELINTNKKGAFESMVDIGNRKVTEIQIIEINGESFKSPITLKIKQKEDGTYYKTMPI